ncbi:MAG: proton-conducting transporter membrane subunit [Nevskiales bacterium]
MELLASLKMSPSLLMALAMLIPLAGALLICVTSRWPNLRETMTLLTALSLFACVLGLLPSILAGESPQLLILEFLPDLPLLLVLEPLGMLFALIASGLWIINSLYSIGYMRGNNEAHQTGFYICFAIALAATMGIAMAGNLLTLFLFYEALTFSTYPLVTHKRNANALAGGRRYLGYLLASSLILLMTAIVLTYVIGGSIRFTPEGILAGKLDSSTGALLLALYVFGIGKAGLMPIHRWLPAAMVAPTPVSALLHAVAVVKAGVFCVVKIIIYVFGLETLRGADWAGWLVYAASFTVITASVIALYQDNLKRRLAYSTISQLGYVVLAAAVLAPLSMLGAVVHIAAHAVSKITLFFAAGAIYTASKKTEVSQLNGIGRAMPWTMTAFAIGSLSMIGLPPTVGFTSKWYMLGGALDSGQLFVVVVLLVSTLLNAGYYLPIVYRAFINEPDKALKHGEAPWPSVVALTLTAAGTIVLFFYPQPVIKLAQLLLGSTS